MAIWSAITSLFGGEGGLGSTILKGIESYFPPSMSEKEKAELQMAINNSSREYELKMMEVTKDAEEQFNQRIKDMEGTATDLKTIPVIGHILIFLRGAQRPIWGFSTLYLDLMVFSKQWKLTPESMEESSFFIINLLVLGFLFGERAVKNLAPVIERIVGKFIAKQ